MKVWKIKPTTDGFAVLRDGKKVTGRKTWLDACACALRLNYMDCQRSSLKATKQKEHRRDRRATKRDLRMFTVEAV